MQIRKATMNDLPNILAIYAYARKYMKEHGNPDQWRTVILRFHLPHRISNPTAYMSASFR